MRRSAYLYLLASFWASFALGWGELGHQTIGRVAAKLAAQREPGLGAVLGGKWLQQGHVANIPDIYWRNLEGKLAEDGQLLGDATHFLSPEHFMNLSTAGDFFKVKVPLSYQEAKVFFESKRPGLRFFHDAGTIHWRAQQFSDLFLRALRQYPHDTCKELDASDDHPTMVALTYAGLLSHFTGDASQPLHVTTDYDGAATGEKGLHTYFETDLVDALEGRLIDAVTEKARALLEAPASVPGSIAALRAKVAQVYPDAGSSEVTGLVLAEAADSYSHLDELRELDRKYALVPKREAAGLAQCRHLKPGVPCRRPPRTVAQHFAPLIVQRLAVAAVLTADVWAKSYAAAGRPTLCWTWHYALKPSFVSPTDEACAGYALREDPRDFLKKDGTSALPWKKLSSTADGCLAF